ncbi:hypothetical protein Cgig2_029044 [Carnegiea gigantea]|uniref:Major facilitator superfamily (MFS) profile domain-containing protein n=1 Tax=Carnegiea gigantea TaxID=171969 RepID=A0A9Q1QFD7_9CARY|nr:hypothetical protein Cgig2_029044 [Carnegiea gigantea]
MEDEEVTREAVTEGGNYGLSHLLMTIFLYNFSTFMVIPAITDVTMSALCPGQDECSLAIYLTGFQHAMIGAGTLVMMPLIGNLSDLYGRKALLTVPMTLTILPLGILAYERTTSFFYAYYVLKTLTSMLCEGSVHCIAYAYVADKVGERRRASVFGVLSGISSCAFVCGNLSTRFLSTPSTFQVSAAMALLAALYMKIFLPESIKEPNLSLHTKLIQRHDDVSELNRVSSGIKHLFKGLPSPSDMISLLKTRSLSIYSCVIYYIMIKPYSISYFLSKNFNLFLGVFGIYSSAFSQAALVAFFANLGDVGLNTALMYYLKARFRFNKDQFADLMVIVGVAGTASQIVIEWNLCSPHSAGDQYGLVLWIN